MKELFKKLLPAPLLALIRTRREARRQARFQAAAATRISRYLESHELRKLQIGSGPYTMDGWLNTDIVPHNDDVVFMDCTKRFPLADCSFDYIFTEHLIEHLAYQDGQILLREAYRILKPGGKIRIATPDLRFLIALYSPNKTDVQGQYIAWTAQRWPCVEKARDVFVINHFFRAWGHQFIYDPQTLQDAMSQVGFTAITLRLPRQSDEVMLQGIEKHGQAITEAFNALETFVLEGQKTV